MFLCGEKRTHLVAHGPVSPHDRLPQLHIIQGSTRITAAAALSVLKVDLKAEWGASGRGQSHASEMKFRRK